MRTLLQQIWLFWLLPVGAFGGIVLSMSDIKMATDWFANEGPDVMLWWFIVTLAGLATLPLLYRLLPSLPDRGYGLARLAGMLLVGFVFWFLASIGLLKNSPGAVATAWIIVLGASVLSWVNWENRPSVTDVSKWAQREYPLLIMTEVVFLVALVGWSFLRAHNPELTLTEKPMEMAFINGVRNSETFPPKDPWLSDYAISYYYFGYVMIAALADLTAVPTTQAFNMAGALTFALTATAALSVGYNLVRSGGPLGRWRSGTQFAGVGTGLLAATFIVLAGHLGSVLVDLPYRGYASTIPIANEIVGPAYFEFWDVDRFDSVFYATEFDENGNFVGYRLLDTNQLVAEEPSGYARMPDRDGDGIADWDDDPPQRDEFGFDWWAQSRIVKDIDLAGNQIGTQPIAEFPQFSFLLADNHPHVLGLPFTVLMIGLAIALALRANPLRPWEILVYGIFTGGMIFLNAWDAVYLVIIIAAEALRRLLRNGTGGLTGFGELGAVVTLQSRAENNLLLAGPVFIALIVYILLTGSLSAGIFPLMNFVLQIMAAALLTVPLTLLVNWVLTDTDWAAIVRFGGYLGAIFAIFYYPWIVSFTSQANGFYPNIIYPTRSQQYFLQFGMFVLLLIPMIVVIALQARRRISYMNVLVIVLFGMVLMLGVPVVSTVYIEASCPLTDQGLFPNDADLRPACEARRTLFGGVSNASVSESWTVLERRLSAAPTQIVMLTLLGVIAMRLFPRPPASDDAERDVYNLSPTLSVALLLIAAGIVASLAPDLMYLRDNFNQRMNTVFKLYYQSWTLFSIGTAFAAYVLLAGLPQRTDAPARRPISVFGEGLRLVYAGGLGIMVFFGLLYPYFALPQHYLYNTGRIAARDCDRNVCPTEDEVTLDGMETLASGVGSYRPRAVGLQERVWSIGDDELAMMHCLLEHEPQPSDAILVEAGGGGYDPGMGRFAMYTGIPTLLGWDNHQGQWRGNAADEIIHARGRWNDIHRIYEIPDAELWEAQGMPIVEQYGIDYIVVGRAERNIYIDQNGQQLPGLFKFEELFDPVCQQGDTAVYRVRPE